MQQIASWEPNRSSDSQEISRILWKQMVHYHLYNSPLSVSILSQINPVHAPTSHFLKIHFNMILLSRPGSSKWSLYIGFPHQNPACTFPLPYISACPSHLILLDLFNRKTFSDQFSSLSFSLCSFLHSSVTSSLFGPNIHLSILFSNTFSLRFSLTWATKFQTHTKPQIKLYFSIS